MLFFDLFSHTLAHLHVSVPVRFGALWCALVHSALATCTCLQLRADPARSPEFSGAIGTYRDLSGPEPIFHTIPIYTDTQPWPATKTIWTYKAIYRADDDPARRDGHWSQAVSVAGGG
jgi:hypothetical protein